MAISTFLCYNNEDKRLALELRKHLTPLESNGLIALWDYGDISPGTEGEEQIAKYLDEAPIILLLISASFLHSQYLYRREMQRAIERHESKNVRVIPVILRPVLWKEPPLDKLQPLPDSARPITMWTSRDAGFENVAIGMRELVRQWDAHSLPDPTPERGIMIANFDRLVASVRAQLQPPGRAKAIADTLQELHMSIFIPVDVTLADLAVGWQTLSRSSNENEEEEIAIARRRVTCGELAHLASHITTEQGSLAQAIRTWNVWQEAFKNSDDDRQKVMASTFARELAELQAAMH